MIMSYLRPSNFIAVAFAIGMTTMLASCSKEPSALDIEKTLRAEAAVNNNILIYDVQKIGCASAQDSPGYICDVEVDATVTQTMPFGRPVQLPRSKAIAKIRFIEDGDKWKTSANWIP